LEPQHPTALRTRPGQYRNYLPLALIYLYLIKKLPHFMETLRSLLRENKPIFIHVTQRHRFLHRDHTDLPKILRVFVCVYILYTRIMDSL